MNIIIKTTLFSLCLLTAFTASAWSIFGSSEGNTQSRLKAADKLLEKADNAFVEELYDIASNGYVRAMERYRAIERDDPEYQDGLPSIRVAYCMQQLSQYGNKTPNDAVNGADNNSAKSAFLKSTDSDDDNSSTDNDVEEESSFHYEERYFNFDFAEAKDLLKQNRPREAIEVLVPMMNFDPGNRQVRMLLAIAMLKTGQPDRAIAALEDLRGRKEDLPLLLLISAAYTSSGRYPDALLSLDEAIKLAPADPDAYTNLAWLTLIMNNNNPEAKSVAKNYYTQSLKRGGQKDLKLEQIIQ